LFCSKIFHYEIIFTILNNKESLFHSIILLQRNISLRKVAMDNGDITYLGTLKE